MSISYTYSIWLIWDIWVIDVCIWLLVIIYYSKLTNNDTQNHGSKLAKNLAEPAIYIFIFPAAIKILNMDFLQNFMMIISDEIA